MWLKVSGFVSLQEIKLDLINTPCKDKCKVYIYLISESWLATTIFASLNSVAYTFHVLACYR